MRIIILNHNIRGIGTYIRCFHFATHLVQFGHTVTLLTSIPSFSLLPRIEEKEGVSIVCMPDIVGKRLRNGGLGPVDTLLRCFYVLGGKADVVMSFDHRPAVLFPSLVWKFLRRKPLVSEWTDLHGTGGSLSNRSGYMQKIIGPYENFTERISKKIADHLVVISSGLKEMALGLDIPESKITWISGGADVKNIQLRPKREVRKQFGLPEDKKIICYSAGTQYDLDLLVKTVNLIQTHREEAIFVTTGAYMEPGFREKIKDKTRIWELGFLPYEKYSTLLSAADVFLFPFTNRQLNIGRWPNKIGDYMAAGRPIVTNPTGDMVGVFKQHAIGLLAQEDPEHFCSQVLRLLDNEDLSSEYGRNARVAAEKHFDWMMLTRHLEACLLEAAR